MSVYNDSAEPPGSRTWASVSSIAYSRFKGEDKKGHENFRTAWRYLYRRGLTDGFNIMADNPPASFVALTMAWMERVLMDADLIKVEEVCARCGATLDEYLEWEQSDLGKYVKRVDSAIAKERMDGSTRRVLRKIVEWVTEKDDKKGAELFLRATGQLDGVKDNSPGLPVKVIQTYVMGDNRPKEVPQAKVHKPELTPSGEAALRIQAKFRSIGGRPIKDVDRSLSSVHTTETLKRKPDRHIDRASAHKDEVAAMREDGDVER